MFAAGKACQAQRAEYVDSCCLRGVPWGGSCLRGQMAGSVTCYVIGRDTWVTVAARCQMVTWTGCCHLSTEMWDAANAITWDLDCGLVLQVKMQR